MTPESNAAVLARIEAVFRRMLAAGKPVAIEDARRCVWVPDTFSPSCLGGLVRRMKDAGEITFHGYRRSEAASRHAGIARLWVLADARSVTLWDGMAHETEMISTADLDRLAETVADRLTQYGVTERRPHGLATSTPQKDYGWVKVSAGRNCSNRVTIACGRRNLSAAQSCGCCRARETRSGWQQAGKPLCRALGWFLRVLFNMF